MTMRSVFTKSLLLSASLATGFALLSAMHEAFAGEPVHGPGSSHNPIVYHPVHGPGSSHNPIVVSTSKYPPGTVVRDHRNGKNCQYTVGILLLLVPITSANTGTAAAAAVATEAPERGC